MFILCLFSTALLFAYYLQLMSALQSAHLPNEKIIGIILPGRPCILSGEGENKYFKNPQVKSSLHFGIENRKGLSSPVQGFCHNPRRCVAAVHH
jgi:hypothetical protein